MVKHRVGVQEKTLKVISLDDEWWGELLATAEPAPSPPGVAQQVTAQPVNAADPTGRKPASFILFDQTYAVKSWKGLLTQLSALLAARHPDDFSARATTLKGRKRHFFAPSPDGMVNPAPIAGVDLYVETNLSAKDIIKLCHRLLAALAYDPDALHVNYKPSSQTNA